MTDYMELIRTNLKLYRINGSMTQNELANRSGVSARSITRFENGGDINLSNLIKLMEALGLSQNLALLVPDQAHRPSAYLTTQKQKQRAGRKKAKPATGTFKWGDEL